MTDIDARLSALEARERHRVQAMRLLHRWMCGPELRRDDRAELTVAIAKADPDYLPPPEPSPTPGLSPGAGAVPAAHRRPCGGGSVMSPELPPGLTVGDANGPTPVLHIRGDQLTLALAVIAAALAWAHGGPDEALRLADAVSAYEAALPPGAA